VCAAVGEQAVYWTPINLLEAVKGWFTGDYWRESAFTARTKVSGGECSLQESGKNNMTTGSEEGLHLCSMQSLIKTKTLYIYISTIFPVEIAVDQMFYD